ncbi:MAG TPA: hypothetical protein VMM56_01445 [Planctomycetaceae bacterium]|nr:hypothetical protein [Planctomycetaceae bacterium]
MKIGIFTGQQLTFAVSYQDRDEPTLVTFSLSTYGAQQLLGAGAQQDFATGAQQVFSAAQQLSTSQQRFFRFRPLKRRLNSPRFLPQQLSSCTQQSVGAAQLMGAGAQQALGAGAQQAFGAGAQQAAAAGAQQDFGAGAQQALGAGAQQAFGAGAQQALGAGAQQAFGAGAQQALGAGAQQALATGAQHDLATGAQQLFAAGAQHDFGAGAQQLGSTSQHPRLPSLLNSPASACALQHRNTMAVKLIHFFMTSLLKNSSLTNVRNSLVCISDGPPDFTFRSSFLARVISYDNYHLVSVMKLWEFCKRCDV